MEANKILETKVAVIDLGTNTFHLLIVSIADGKFNEVYRNRIFVNLAEAGIQSIGSQPMQRAKAAIKQLANHITNHKISHCTIIGTAAMRTADNGPELVEFIESTLHYPVEIIDGKTEAELIFEGTRLVTDLSTGYHIIMDIGGGSTEFILTKNNSIQWAQSFPIGVTVLYNAFGGTDPLAEKSIIQLKAYLDEKLAPLMDQLKDHACQHLIGASGTFEVLQLSKEKRIIRDKASQFSIPEFYELYHDIITSNLEDRLRKSYIPPQRAKLLPVAMVLIQHLLECVQPEGIIISPYALKEGIISKYLD